MSVVTRGQSTRGPNLSQRFAIACPKMGDAAERWAVLQADPLECPIAFGDVEFARASLPNVVERFFRRPRSVVQAAKLSGRVPRPGFLGVAPAVEVDGSL